MTIHSPALIAVSTEVAPLVAPAIPILSDVDFWTRLRTEILPLRPSQYDLTSRCNLTCEGCLFFSGAEYLAHSDQDDTRTLEAFFGAEAGRGVNYGYFGGAEPSLVEHKLVIASRHVPYGVVFTNGTRRVSAEVPYRIHVSVWGRPERSRALRGADMLMKQVRNYRDDARAVFVFTITAQNIDDLPWIASFCADERIRLSFNHYSPTTKYLSFLQDAAEGDRFHSRSSAKDDLLLSPDRLALVRDVVGRLIDEHRTLLLYTHAMNDLMTDAGGLYPDLDATTGVAKDCRVRLDESLRHYNTDLSRSDGKCCTPNVACSTCRLYAHSLSTLLTRATRDLRRPGERARILSLWRLWCALFLNDDRLSAWAG